MVIFKHLNLKYNCQLSIFNLNSKPLNEVRSTSTSTKYEVEVEVYTTINDFDIGKKKFEGLLEIFFVCKRIKSVPTV